MVYLGFDLGSSSVKAALIDAADGREIARAHAPESEMAIDAPHPGWAEQDPEAWWTHAVSAARKLFSSKAINPTDVGGIGIAYQMHGLVAVGEQQEVIRPSIIWCDSRAVQTGDALFEKIGPTVFAQRMLNHPGNFTLSKLLWVKENEPEQFKRIHKIMLPGDYLAMKLTGNITTTSSGLSEGILWDFQENTPAHWLLESCGLSTDLLPALVPSLGKQGELSAKAAAILGLPEGIPIAYRAGDQPNNALSLNVMEPGEVAATGGTSGVVYAVSDQADHNEISRINQFAHVNHTAEAARIGKLLCINGTGIQYGWLRKLMGENLSYDEMNARASALSPGSDGLSILPFGNGAERMLDNRFPGASMHGIDFNRHCEDHLCRAALEGIAFAFAYGMELMQGTTPISKIRAGSDNLFQAAVFGTTLATLSGASIELVNTTGAIGAARAAGLACGSIASLAEACATDSQEGLYLPQTDTSAIQEAYQRWKQHLRNALENKTS